MVRKASLIGAALALVGAGLPASAAIIRTARHASTSNHTVATTTAGQRSILMTVDPLNVAAFSLDVTFEAEKVEFAGLQGLNGYIIDFYQFSTDGNAGGILNIHGYYPGYNDHRIPVDSGLTAAAPLEAAAPPSLPPAGEVDIFQLTFLDLAPNQDKMFEVFASDNMDYITALNTDTGELTSAIGPYNPMTDQGVDGATSVVTAVPLPPGVLMGGLGGLGVLAGLARRRTRV
jgi:hypothetical protein